MGRIVKDKGIDELMQAFSVLYAGNSNLRLIVIGHFEDHLDPISDEAREIFTSTRPSFILTGVMMWNISCTWRTSWFMLRTGKDFRIPITGRCHVLPDRMFCY